MKKCPMTLTLHTLIYGERIFTIYFDSTQSEWRATRDGVVILIDDKLHSLFGRLGAIIALERNLP